MINGSSELSWLYCQTEYFRPGYVMFVILPKSDKIQGINKYVASSCDRIILKAGMMQSTVHHYYKKKPQYLQVLYHLFRFTRLS